MKKIISFAFALAAISFAVSCNKETATVETETVSFTIELPGAIQSKAIADGTKALTLYYATYTQDEKQLASLSNTSNGTAVSGKTATVTLQLVKDIPYHVVFWAQSEDCDAFTFDWPNATMTVSYDGDANDDLRDAFYTVLNDVIVDKDEKVTVSGTPLEGAVGLYRPFAQINFGAADYESVTEYFEVDDVDKRMTSELTWSVKIPNTLNLLDQTIDGEASASFSPTVIPGGEDKTLTVKGEDYRYVSMNYVLAPAGNNPAAISQITATFTYDNNVNDTKTDIVRPIVVNNVPILRNYRTNILGNFFTVDTPIVIQIMEKFEDDRDDMIIEYPEPAQP